MRITPSIHRIGNDSRVNSYLVDDSGEVTIIDAAMPGFYGEIPKELAAMGRTIEDVRAVVLTHGHSDHLGFAERIRTERDLLVWIHEADAALARGETDPDNPMGKIRFGPMLGFLWLGLRNGGLKRPVVEEVSTMISGFKSFRTSGSASMRASSMVLRRFSMNPSGRVSFSTARPLIWAPSHSSLRVIK